jgi:hypothetical protein
MQQILDRPPASEASSVAASSPGAIATRGRAVELAALAALFAAAVCLRWPYLWDVPRFTDELQEVLWSLSIARGEILPLTAVDSYYGPLWSYLLAGLFKVFGPSSYLPRLTAMLLAASLVLVTYLFARDVVGRWPAAIAAGLLLTSGGHIIINSHTARSNSTTPLLTTAALWLVYRAIADRKWDSAAGKMVERQPDPRLLVPAGLLFGLALQTHLSAIALVPGLAVYMLWQEFSGRFSSPATQAMPARRRHILRSPWPYVGVLAVLAGYVNMVVYNLQSSFWSLHHARSLQEGYAEGRSTDLAYYLANFGNLVQSLSRLLSGTIDTPDNPSRFVYALLALLGLALLARRGGLLIVLATLSMVAVLPYFNPRYGPILSGRYLIPLLPLLFTAIGCLLVSASQLATRPLLGRRQVRWQPLAVLLGLAVSLYPLFPLHSYYQEVVADGRTNQPLYRLLDSILAARRADEIVLLDEGLAQEQLGAGGTDLKAFRMLLETRGIPYQVEKVTSADNLQLSSGSSTLFLMETKKRTSLPRDMRASPVSQEVASASGNEHRYAVYRVGPR